MLSGGWRVSEEEEVGEEEDVFVPHCPDSHQGMNPVRGSFCTVSPHMVMLCLAYASMNFTKYSAHVW